MKYDNTISELSADELLAVSGGSLAGGVVGGFIGGVVFGSLGTLGGPVGIVALGAVGVAYGASVGHALTSKQVEQ